VQDGANLDGLSSEGPLRHVESVLYEEPGIEYAAFLKYRNSADEQPAAVTVRMSDKRHTYDMRNGQYLGDVSEWPAEFTPARAKLFARLPYHVKDVKVSAKVLASSARDEQVGPTVACEVALTADQGAPGGHWIELTVTGPDGAPRPHYARNVQLANGKATSSIPLALDDPRGQWKITARDSISHLTATSTFTVR